jgi:hypothetical protein
MTQEVQNPKDNPADALACPAPNEKLHSQAVDELYKFAITNFAKLDSDDNNYITIPDLDNAINTGNFKSDEITKINALKDNLETISALSSDDPIFTESDGISPSDLVAVDKLWLKRETNVKYAERIRDFTLANYEKLDFDHRGTLFGYEIVSLNGEGRFGDKEALLNDLSAYDKESFKLLDRNMRYIGHAQDHPADIPFLGKPAEFSSRYAITRDELEKYPQAVSNRPKYELVNKLEEDLIPETTPKPTE